MEEKKKLISYHDRKLTEIFFDFRLFFFSFSFFFSYFDFRVGFRKTNEIRTLINISDWFKL